MKHNNNKRQGNQKRYLQQKKSKDSRLLDENKIKKGKIYANVGVFLLIFALFLGLVAKLLRNEDVNILGDIAYPAIFVGVIALYYKGNQLAFKIISAILPYLFMVPVLFVFGPTIYLLAPIGILNLWGGVIFLIILAVYIGLMYWIFKKIGWFECLEEYRLYKIENKSSN